MSRPGAQWGISSYPSYIDCDILLLTHRHIFRFNVSYCLSQPNSSWTGLRGRVDSKMLDDFLSIAVDETNDFPAFFISACGPIKFAEMIQE